MMDMWLFSESKLRTKFDTINVNRSITKKFIIFNEVFSKPISKNKSKNNAQSIEIR